jgi:hypothetical protein
MAKEQHLMTETLRCGDLIDLLTISRLSLDLI